MTTRPSECTHLLAPQLVRTEKFLCALVVAPFILTEKWAIQSAAVKKLLREFFFFFSSSFFLLIDFFFFDGFTLIAEKGFALHDVSGENKYGVDLTQSLRRAKGLGGKLLAGQTFYVTPKVPVDTKLLKNVVTACGGQVSSLLFFFFPCTLFPFLISPFHPTPSLGNHPTTHRTHYQRKSTEPSCDLM